MNHKKESICHLRREDPRHLPDSCPDCRDESRVSEWMTAFSSRQIPPIPRMPDAETVWNRATIIKTRRHSVSELSRIILLAPWLVATISILWFFVGHQPLLHSMRNSLFSFLGSQISGLTRSVQLMGQVLAQFTIPLSIVLFTLIGTMIPHTLPFKKKT